MGYKVFGLGFRGLRLIGFRIWGSELGERKLSIHNGVSNGKRTGKHVKAAAQSPIEALNPAYKPKSLILVPKPLITK